MEKEIKEEFNKIQGRFDCLEKRLFKGNGNPPWDVRLDRLERFKAGLCWAVGIVYIAIVGIVCSFFKK